MATLSEKISDYFSKLNFNIIPGGKIEALKWLTLDCLGVACKGSETESGRIAIENAVQ